MNRIIAIQENIFHTQTRTHLHMHTNTPTLPGRSGPLGLRDWLHHYAFPSSPTEKHTFLKLLELEMPIGRVRERSKTVHL